MLAKKAIAAVSAGPKVYVEDVFSTYLYTGNGSTGQTISNGIDLSTEGGLVWTKGRGNFSENHGLVDTVRGSNKYLASNNTDAEGTGTQLTGFTSTGYTLGAVNGWEGNTNGRTYASWTFRKAKKFFDVVTYTGNGVGGRTVAHNLGSTPGCILIKSTSATADWAVWHRGDGTTAVSSLSLNTSDSSLTSTVTVNSTEFSTAITNYLGAGQNVNGRSYVAYLFAHDAGGFGDAGSDSIIKCGSVVGSSQVEVNLGWEPQWLLVKNASAYQDWWVVDNMRGLPVQDTSSVYNASALRPNLSDAETTGFSIAPSATGFKANVLTSSQTYIYIAIRRGPMKTPTSGTSVYSGVARTGTGATATVTGVGFPSDLVLLKNRSSATAYDWNVYDRLRGATIKLATNSTNLESTETNGLTSLANMDGYTIGPANEINASTVTFINYSLRRAPGFFDVVCYTGTGSATTQTHNLGVAPELMIVKRRDSAGFEWDVWCSAFSTPTTNYLWLNSSAAVASSSSEFGASPTSSVFSVGTASRTNASGGTYVAYLFASVSGVSKVGSYTGNGSSVTVTTDFQPRFILVKRTDSTGNWIVSDSARGLVAGSDPYLLLNSTAAEDTDEDWVDITSTSFTVNQTTAANANVNTGTYIYLAIA